MAISRIEAMLKSLYVSKISFLLSTQGECWKAGLGYEACSFSVVSKFDTFDTIAEAVEYLRASAICRYPNSEFAKSWKDGKIGC